jgi:DNA-binding NtrC family response regulator
MDRPKALVVDDDPATRSAIVAALVEHGFDAVSTRAGTAPSQPVEVLAVDLGAAPAREWAERMGRSHPGLLVVALGNKNETALQPFDSLDKPVDESRLRGVARRLRSVVALRSENRALLGELQRSAAAVGIVGRSRATRELLAAVSRHARSPEPVWFAGESGVGKQHAARVMHAMSERGGLDFTLVPCASIAFAEPILAEPCGTLYLENLPALPLDHQRQVERRATTDRGADTGRLVASATSHPAHAAEVGRLLEELRTRFEPNVIVIPPLRERPEDVSLLARHFADRIGELNRLPSLDIDAAAIALLEAHAWPGNATELRSVIEHAALLATEGPIRAAHLPESIRSGASERDERSRGGTTAGAPAAFRTAKRSVVASFEASYLRDLLAYHGGNVTAAARHAGMLRSALQRLLRKHGLRSGDFRTTPGRADSRTLSSSVDESG